MKKEILYAAAMDTHGKLIKVGDAAKGNEYFCPSCGGQMVLKKSNSSGKGSRRPHFSHLQLTTNCTPEGVLHFSFKKLLVAYLEKCLSESHQLELGWTCADCKSNVSGNLLRHIATVKEEYDLSVCRPDIALLDREGNVLVVIEVVVTHAPEDKVLHHYKESDVVLVQINLASDGDLNEVEAKIKKPDKVAYCMKRSCPNYGASTIERFIQISRSQCGRCTAPIEKYSILVKTMFGEQSSLDFSETEIAQLKARSRSVTVKHESGSNEMYPVFTCENCKRLLYQYGRRSPRL